MFGGSTAASPTSGGSLFGGTTSFGSPQQSTAGSVFGSSAFGGGGGGFAQTATTAASVFGNSFSTSNASPFGGATVASPPAFGGSTVHTHLYHFKLKPSPPFVYGKFMFVSRSLVKQLSRPLKPDSVHRSSNSNSKVVLV